jgi:extracellular factor (EF) 3-hydroxypalmitic acid methyl ester biosynthesis protein
MKPPAYLLQPFALGPRDLPSTLVQAVEAFKTVMLDVDRALKDRLVCGDSAQRQVSAACDEVECALREHIEREPYLEDAIGHYVFRETFPYFTRSRLVDRAFTKPRGYAGDFATIDMLYEDSAEGDGRLGPLIDRWARWVPAAQAVKNRRPLLAEAIREAAAGWRESGGMPVTSLGAGPARELFDVVTRPARVRLLATCIDIDRQALAHTSAIAHQLGVAHEFVFAKDNVVRLAQGRGQTVLDPQALIYSVGLTDYLDDGVVLQLINWVYDQLLPGGTLILGNVLPSNPDKAYMDHILEWRLIHRDADELCDLFARSRFCSTPIVLQAEPAGVNLFAFCRKA